MRGRRGPGRGHGRDGRGSASMRRPSGGPAEAQRVPIIGTLGGKSCDSTARGVAQSLWSCCLRPGYKVHGWYLNQLRQPASRASVWVVCLCTSLPWVRHHRLLSHVSVPLCVCVSVDNPPIDRFPCPAGATVCFLVSAAEGNEGSREGVGGGRRGGGLGTRERGSLHACSSNACQSTHTLALAPTQHTA